MRTFLAILSDTAYEATRGISVYILLGFCALIALVLVFGVTNVREERVEIPVTAIDGTETLELLHHNIMYDFFGDEQILGGASRRQAVRSEIFKDWFLRYIFSKAGVALLIVLFSVTLASLLAPGNVELVFSSPHRRSTILIYRLLSVFLMFVAMSLCFILPSWIVLCAKFGVIVWEVLPGMAVYAVNFFTFAALLAFAVALTRSAMPGVILSFLLIISSNVLFGAVVEERFAEDANPVWRTAATTCYWACPKFTDVARIAEMTTGPDYVQLSELKNVPTVEDASFAQILGTAMPAWKGKGLWFLLGMPIGTTLLAGLIFALGAVILLRRRDF